MKTKLMGTVLAILLVGCGTEEARPADASPETKAGVQSGVSCEDIDQAVASVRDGLGSCTANYKNQEPLAFSRSVCDAQLSTACSAADLEIAQQYVACLRAVAACEPAQQALFDEAIDTCLDTFQNSGASEECIELVVGD